MLDGVDQSGGASHTHEHAHETAHSHLHAHTGEHSHTHPGLDPKTVHTHEHTHEIMHDHDHAHEGDHTHAHDTPADGDRAEFVALLTDILGHNRVNEAELQKQRAGLESLGLQSAAEQLDLCCADYASGNAKLAEILKSLADE